ncbi:helix-turn-helix domain-containing protein [Actinosynnema sp. NPDC020468]|uniref:helix-turn-helix domain-containing protein n=1 Tax=Actinosynnema sp. NPDC020468 TaxID=3154488 RepID=UPI003404B076
MREALDITVGQRIEHMRRRRGMSRRTLASLLGYSDEWLRQVERRGRPVDRVSTVLRLADILQVRDVLTLMDTATRRERRQEEGVATGAIREALLRHWRRGATTHDPEPLTRAELDEARRLWCDSERRYTVLRGRLPDLLDRLGTVADDRAGRLLRAEAFRLTSRYLLRTGDVHFAQIAADGALAELADQRGGPGWFAAVGQLAEVLLRSGSPGESRWLVTDTTAQLVRATPDQCTTLVRLHAIGAEAAAGVKDYRGAQQSLESAREVAARLGAPWTVLVEVAATRVELAVGRAAQALRLAADVEGIPLLCKGMQSACYLTLARAHLAEGDLIATTFALMQTERVHGDDIRFDVQVRHVLAEAMGSDSASVRNELGWLAERAGIL